MQRAYHQHVSVGMDVSENGHFGPTPKDARTPGPGHAGRDVFGDRGPGRSGSAPRPATKSRSTPSRTKAAP
jgi:hypothetical protein